MKKKAANEGRTPSDHLPDEQILERIEGRLSASGAARMDEHLGTCRKCRQRGKELAAVVEPLARRNLETPPEWLRNWSEDLPRSHPRPMPRTTPRLLRLSFDSWALRPAGARSGATGARRLVFRSGPVDLDMQVEIQPASGRIRIRGQVLDGSVAGGRTFTAGQVEVRSGRRRAAGADLRKRGEFVLPDLEPGRYELRITARGLSCRAPLEI